MIIAHRGASSMAPENTLTAFEKAIEVGADCIELDVRRSSDDSLMVIHDETIDRTTNGSGKVDSYSYQQLKAFSAGYADKFGSDYYFEKIPTLFEVLKLAKGKVKVCIDTKNCPESMVIAQVNKSDIKGDVFLMSYNIDKLIRIESFDPEIKTVLIKNILTGIDIEMAEEAGLHAVSGSPFSNPFLAKKAHDSGLEYWAGVVADPADAQKLFGYGVDAVLTDHPQLMIMKSRPLLRVFPMPFRDFLIIQMKFPDEINQAVIITPDGKIVYHFPEPYKQIMYWKPDAHIKQGWYLVYIIQDNEMIVEKVLYY